MSKQEAVIVVSRTLAVLLLVTALADVSYLPGNIYAFLHYSNVELSSPTATEYYRHANLIQLSFLIVRIIGFFLLSRWLFNGGPEVADLLLPASAEEIMISNKPQ
jgi:hypothetical protein